MANERAMSSPARRLTLLERGYCHLCERMREALAPMLAGSGVVLDRVDVDANDALEARWGSLVPVLLDGERELCHFRLDAAAVRAWLREPTPGFAP